MEEDLGRFLDRVIESVMSMDAMDQPPGTRDEAHQATTAHSQFDNENKNNKNNDEPGRGHDRNRSKRDRQLTRTFMSWSEQKIAHSGQSHRGDDDDDHHHHRSSFMQDSISPLCGIPIARTDHKEEDVGVGKHQVDSKMIENWFDSTPCGWAGEVLTWQDVSRLFLDRIVEAVAEKKNPLSSVEKQLYEIMMSRKLQAVDDSKNLNVVGPSSATDGELETRKTNDLKTPLRNNDMMNSSESNDTESSDDVSDEMSLDHVPVRMESGDSKHVGLFNNQDRPGISSLALSLNRTQSSVSAPSDFSSSTSSSILASNASAISLLPNVPSSLNAISGAIAGLTGLTKVHLLTKELIAAQFHLPRKLAAKKLNTCVTLLKRRCREVGIYQWPFRKMRAIDIRIRQLELQNRTAAIAEETPGKSGPDGTNAATHAAESISRKKIQAELKHLENLKSKILQNPNLQLKSKGRRGVDIRPDHSSTEMQ